MFKYSKILMIAVTTATVLSGCTKLNEVVLDESSATGLTPKQAAEGAIAPVYALLP